MPDIPAIAAVAHARGALVIDDNTWATPLYHRSLEQGVDISMQAATKYIGGHSDIMFGTISANAKAWPQLAEGIKLLGVCAGPDDVYLALRGLRTLSVRLAQHHKSGLEMARWLGDAAGGRARAAPRAREPIPATRSGSATSPAHPACSASCSNRLRRKPSMRCSIP